MVNVFIEGLFWLSVTLCFGYGLFLWDTRNDNIEEVVSEPVGERVEENNDIDSPIYTLEDIDKMTEEEREQLMLAMMI